MIMFHIILKCAIKPCTEWKKVSEQLNIKMYNSHNYKIHHFERSTKLPTGYLKICYYVQCILKKYKIYTVVINSVDRVLFIWLALKSYTLD